MDDWSIDVEPPDIVTVPSFIRLFILGRILKNVIGTNDTKHAVKKLITEIHDPKTSQVIEYILTQLINHGIKKYMKCYFNENDQLKAIEVTFNDIILKKFDKEYQNTMIYFANGNVLSPSEYYKISVFNTDDLMHLIFQFIELESHFTGDLINCRLVSSHWLYQSWNPNSVYHFQLGALLSNAKGYTINSNLHSDDNNHKKEDDVFVDGTINKWQRIAKVQSIGCWAHGSFARSYLDTNYYLLQKLSMLTRITRIAIYITDNHIPWLKILYRQRNNIERFYVLFRSNHKNVLSPLPLINAKEIYVFNMYYYIMWTNKCDTLVLNRLDDIDNKWCQYVIDNCDCSGIKKIVFDNVTFCDKSMNARKNSPKLLIKQFAQKFVNVKQIVLECFPRKGNQSPDACLLLLIKYLCPIVKKNMTRIRLQTYSFVVDLFKLFQDTGVTSINELDICAYKNYNFNVLKPLISKNHDLEYIGFYTGGLSNIMTDLVVPLLKNIDCEDNDDNDDNDGSDDNDSLQAPIEKNKVEKLSRSLQFALPLSSLKMIEISDGNDKPIVNFNAINDLLLLNSIHNNKVFIKLDMAIAIGLIDDNENILNDFKVSFDKMCQNIFSSLTKHQIPMDLQICMDDVSKTWYKDILNPIFNEYFDNHQELNHQNMVPICNKYCKPIPVAQIMAQIDFEEETDEDSVDDVDDSSNDDWLTARLNVKNAQKNV